MYKEKIWCSFGDSFTYDGAWQPFVEKETGMKHVNCGLGSTTIASRKSNFLTRPALYTSERLGTGEYKNILSRTTDDGVEYNLVIPHNPDVVTIMGGENDVYYGQKIGDKCELTKMLYAKNLNTYIGAYSYIIETLLIWKPTLRIVLLATKWSPPHESFPRIFELADCVAATKEIADYYALPLVDLYHECGINCCTSGIYCVEDKVHPNTLGGKLIAERVIKELNNIIW